MEEYSRIIQDDPENHAVLADRAAAYFRLNELEDALPDINLAIQIAPQNDTIQDFNRVFDLVPDQEDMRALTFLGRGYAYSVPNSFARFLEDGNGATQNVYNVSPTVHYCLVFDKIQRRASSIAQLSDARIN